MGTVGEDGQDRDDVNDDDLDDCAPPVGHHVDGGSAAHCLQPVQGNGGPTQSGDIYRDSLRNVHFTDFDKQFEYRIIALCWRINNKEFAFIKRQKI